MVAAFILNDETFYHFALFEKDKQELFIKINHFFPFSIQNYLVALRRRKEKQWRQSKKERNFNIFWCPDTYISSLRLCAHTIFFDLFNVRAKITWITIDSPITFLFRCFFALSLSLSLRRFCSALGNFLKINHKNRTELNHTINFDQFDYLPSSNQNEHDGSKPMGLVVWDGEMSWSTLKGPTHSVIDDAPIIPVHAVIRKISKHLSENNFCGRMFVKTHIFPSIPSKCK